jgi:hypothetical protein
LAELLTGFFELYGKKFDYITNAISILNGGCYFPKASRKWYHEENPEALAVEDPQNPGILILWISHYIILFTKTISQVLCWIVYLFFIGC